MNHDHIIKEVRTIREQLAASHGYNVRALFAEAKKRRKESGRKVVKLTPRLLKNARLKKGQQFTYLNEPPYPLNSSATRFPT